MQQDVLQLEVELKQLEPYLNHNKNGEYRFNCKHKDAINTVQPCIVIRILNRTYTLQIFKMVHESEISSNNKSTNHIIYTKCLETGVECNYQTNYLTYMFNHPNTSKAFKVATRLTVKGKVKVSKQALEHFYEYEQFESQIQLVGPWVDDETKSMIYCIGNGIVPDGEPHNYIGKTRQADKTSRANSHKHNIKENDMASGNLLYYEFATYGNIAMLDTQDDNIIEYFETLFINLMAYVTGSNNINDKQRGKNKTQQREKILDKLASIILTKVDFKLCYKNLKQLCGFTVQTNMLPTLALFRQPNINIRCSKRYLPWIINLVVDCTDITLDEIIKAVKKKNKPKKTRYGKVPARTI